MTSRHSARGSKGLDPRRNAIFLGGHAHGIAALWALREIEELRQIIKTRRVWVDVGNNVKRRLYRHADNPMFEQKRMLKAAQELEYPDDHIIFQPFDGKLLCRLIRRLRIDLLVVSTFGGLIPREAIDLVNGHVYVCHPAFKFPRGMLYLPEESRGARVMDRIVAEGRTPKAMRMAMLRANERFDAGPIVGATATFPSPVFCGRELYKSSLGQRALDAQWATSNQVGTLLRYHLIRQILSVDEAKEAGLSELELLEQGYPVKKTRLKFRKKGGASKLPKG